MATKRTVRLNKKKIVAKKVAGRKDTIKTIGLDIGQYSKCVCLNSSYESAAPSFALCTDIDKKTNSVTMVSSFTGCRESLSAYAHGCINGDCTYGIDYEKFVKNKTCVLILFSTGTNTHERKVMAKRGRMDVTYKEWVPKSLKASLKIINHYEKRQKWALTKLYRVKYTPPAADAPEHMVYCFIGSRWWVNAPHSFSLFNLFIRLGRYSQTWSIKSNSKHATVVKALEQIKLDGAETGLNDHSRVYVDRWETFFDNFKKIYKGREKIESNWGPKIETHEGIQALTNGYCNDKILSTRFSAALSAKK